MLCPICKEVELRITERQGIEIDYCPQCRGIWLDRGELDKLIERGGQEFARPAADFREAPAPSQPRREPPPRHYDDDDDDYKYRRKRKGNSWLGDLFDFD